MVGGHRGINLYIRIPNNVRGYFPLNFPPLEWAGFSDSLPENLEK